MQQVDLIKNITGWIPVDGGYGLEYSVWYNGHIGHYMAYVRYPKNNFWESLFGIDYEVFEDKFSFSSSIDLNFFAINPDETFKDIEFFLPNLHTVSISEMESKINKIKNKFKIHGGFTYSGFREEGDEKIPMQKWSIGWDYGHYGDQPDIERFENEFLSAKEFLEDQEVREYINNVYHFLKNFYNLSFMEGRRVWSVEEILQEAKSIAHNFLSYQKIRKILFEINDIVLELSRNSSTTKRELLEKYMTATSQEEFSDILAIIKQSNFEIGLV